MISVFVSIAIASIAFGQTQADELKMKTGEMGGRGQVWRIEGRPPQNGVILEITAVANPIAANVTNDLKPSPDWFLYRTTFRFDTEKIAENSQAQVIRIQEGTIRTSYFEIREKAATTAPGEAPKKRFKVD